MADYYWKIKHFGTFYSRSGVKWLVNILHWTDENYFDFEATIPDDNGMELGPEIRYDPNNGYYDITNVRDSTSGSDGTISADEDDDGADIGINDPPFNDGEMTEDDQTDSDYTIPDNGTWIRPPEYYNELASYYKEADLTFPASEPLVIEWARRNFEDPVWGSVATLKVVSDSDRKFIDLYTIQPGLIRMDVYRNGKFYWSGCLDPEFYEEPYETDKGYEVELTFSDFGILDRLRFDMGGGMLSLRSIVERCIEVVSASLEGPDTSALSLTTESGADPFDAEAGLAVRCENFIDEDGEWATFREVLEGILTPLGVCMVQRFGTLYLFDTAGLPAADGTIRWTSDSQTLGVDKVANNVRISFSPYASENFFDGTLEYDQPYDESLVNFGDFNREEIDTDLDISNEVFYSYHTDYSNNQGVYDNTDIDFTLFLDDKSAGGTMGALTSESLSYRFFHILPVLGGADECSGVEYLYTRGHAALSSSLSVQSRTIIKGDGTKVLTLKRIFIPYLDYEERQKYYIRVMQEILIDCRYNPFSGATSDNDTDNQEILEKNSSFVFASLWVTLYDSEEGGNVICSYTNAAVAGYSSRLVNRDETNWDFNAAGPSYNSAWLEWYNPDDLTGHRVGGWQGNRHCIGRPDGTSGRGSYTLPRSLREAPDGEFIPYPPRSGWLEVSVGANLLGYKYGDNCSLESDDSAWDKNSLYRTLNSSGTVIMSQSILRWIMLKPPVVSLVKRNLFFDAAGLEDVEYSGVLASAASDDIDIETTCGTADGAPPTALGLFYDLSTGTQASVMTRGGVTDRPELLLIGSLYSQYAGRKTTLSGEAEITTGLQRLRDDNQDGDTDFILMGDTQDPITDTAEIEVVQIGMDTYQGQEV